MNTNRITNSFKSFTVNTTTSRLVGTFHDWTTLPRTVRCTTSRGVFWRSNCPRKPLHPRRNSRKEIKTREIGCDFHNTEIPESNLQSRPTPANQKHKNHRLFHDSSLQFLELNPVQLQPLKQQSKSSSRVKDADFDGNVHFRLQTSLPKLCRSNHALVHKSIFCPFQCARNSFGFHSFWQFAANIDLQYGEWNADGCAGSGVDRSGQSDAAHDARRRDLHRWDEETQNQKNQFAPKSLPRAARTVDACVLELVTATDSENGVAMPGIDTCSGGNGLRNENAFTHRRASCEKVRECCTWMLCRGKEATAPCRPARLILCTLRLLLWLLLTELTINLAVGALLLSVTAPAVGWSLPGDCCCCSRSSSDGSDTALPPLLLPEATELLPLLLGLSADGVPLHRNQTKFHSIENIFLKDEIWDSEIWSLHYQPVTWSDWIAGRPSGRWRTPDRRWAFGSFPRLFRRLQFRCKVGLPARSSRRP